MLVYFSTMKGILCLIVCISFIYAVGGEDKLELIPEEELKQLFIDEKYVIVLLTENSECTGKCALLEDTLLSVREDLVEDTGGWVIKSYAPQISQQVGLEGSTIVFMRDGRPLLYKGDAKDEEYLLNYFLTNKVSTVHNLTDASFEHETQAATGATTGDWFVLFTRRDCEECQRAEYKLEAVSVSLKGKKNAAIVEREVGAVTARRFGVKTFPAFILFRLGKMYRYPLDVRDVSYLSSFAEETFRNYPSEAVPTPKSPFDDVTEAVADWLRENPGTTLLSIGGFLLAVTIIFLLNRPPPESWTKKSKKKKS